MKTMTPEEQCRAEFEAWAIIAMYNTELTEDGAYRWIGTQSAWEAWQAAWNRRHISTSSDNAPVCFGMDDCSSSALSVCTVSAECGIKARMDK